MPKKGLSDEDWERRLQVYTKDSKAMKQGMAPRKDNRRIYTKYMAIATCPNKESPPCRGVSMVKQSTANVDTTTK